MIKAGSVVRASALALALVVGPTVASAVSPAVKIACRDDYFAHCSAHAVGSPELRKCMRAVGSRLSSRCISALIAAGEVSRTTVARRTTASAN